MRCLMSTFPNFIGLKRHEVSMVGLNSRALSVTADFRSRRDNGDVESCSENDS